MATIFILGGYGTTGRLLARHLLEQTAVDVVVAGRHLEKAQAFAADLNGLFPGERVAAAQVDAADGPGLRRALAGAGLMLVAAPATRHVETVIQAALAARVDYLDIQLDAHKLAVLRAQAPAIERAGLCFITEAGFHPGLPAALVRYVAAQMDRLETAVVACYLNMGRSLPYSEAVDELMEAFRHYQGQVYRDGAWTLPGAYETRPIDFGGAIGTRRGFSMFFEEMADLPHLLPELKELGFYMSSTHWLVDWVITPLVMAGLKIPSDRLARRLGKITWWGMQNLPGPPYGVVLKVEATGARGGRAAAFEVTLAHPDGYELTAIPVVACLRQVLDGTVRRPGLWYMGHLVDPARLFDDMERMGVTWMPHRDVPVALLGATLGF